jgi:hypothetical protein
MATQDLGELFYPQYCRVSMSKDRAQLAFTFQGKDRSPLSIILPMAGAAGLERQLAQCLFLVNSKPPEAAEAVAEPAPTAA